MGEITELILDGIICKTCCAWLNDIVDDVDVPGYPRNCMCCDEELSNNKQKESEK